MALFNVVDSLTIPYGLRLAGTAEAQISYHYGIYGRGLALVQIATVFATSIVLPLVPLITKRQAEKDTQGTTHVIEKTHYMSHIISWPAAFGLLALTLPLNLGLFTDTAGSSMLAIIHFSSVFTAFVLVGTGILQGLNKVKTAAFVIIFGVGLKIILNIVLINILDLNGAALSTLIVYFVLMLVNIYFIKKQVNFLFLTKESIKIIISAGLMGILIFLPSLWIDFTSLSRLMAMLYLMIGVSGGAIIYGVLVVKLKAIDSRFIDDIPLLNKFASKL
jgi:O-antigen/teichoic acid export membrane protein